MQMLTLFLLVYRTNWTKEVTRSPNKLILSLFAPAYSDSRHIWHYTHVFASSLSDFAKIVIQVH